MTPALRKIAIAAVVAVAGPAWAGLDQIRAEPNLEKRSVLAMDNAMAAVKETRAAYNAGDVARATEKAKEIEESVDLAYAALEKTGKDPRRSPKWFKHAEIQSNELLRSIEALEHDMSLDDRAILEKTKERVQQVHDNLLAELMGGKRK
jgi:hypothetical protein